MPQPADHNLQVIEQTRKLGVVKEMTELWHFVSKCHSPIVEHQCFQPQAIPGIRRTESQGR